MQILCVSDWIDPVIYSEQMKNRMAGVEIVFSCGDISTSYLDFIMSELNAPVFFVVGNHIGKSRIKKTPLGRTKVEIPSCFKNLHLKVYNYKGILISGFQGSGWYNGGPFQYRQWEVFFNLFKIVPRLLYNKIKHGRFIDVFVSHAAPYKVGDKDDVCHIGLKGFNWFIKFFKPKLFLHGHIHIYDRNESRIRQYYDTKVINCSGYIKTEI